VAVMLNNHKNGMFAVSPSVISMWNCMQALKGW